MKVFTSLPPGVLHEIRTQIEAAERPVAAALDHAAQMIQSSEAFQDALKSGLMISRLTGTDLVEFIERCRRDRLSTDNTRRFEQRSKKSATRVDETDAPTDDWVAEQLGHFFNERHKSNLALSRAFFGLSEVAALGGGNYDRWLSTERLAHGPIFPDLFKFSSDALDRVEAKVKAA